MKKLLLVLMALSLFACRGFAASATSQIHGTAEGSEIYGTAGLKETGDGLAVDIEVFGAPAGNHGIHIHENGSCDNQGEAAGSHFNPAGTPHGFLPKDGFDKAHSGDFGNILVGADGHGILKLTLHGLTIKEGVNAVDNRSIILHEKEDDFGQPTGNAGGRIACGVIKSD